MSNEEGSDAKPTETEPVNSKPAGVLENIYPILRMRITQEEPKHVFLDVMHPTGQVHASAETKLRGDELLEAIWNGLGASGAFDD